MTAGGLEAGNTIRIASLEKCVSSLDARTQVIDERTAQILSIVEKLQAGSEKLSDQSYGFALELARSEQRWTAYAKEQTAMEDGLKEVEDLARKNQLTLVKIVALTVGGGALGSLVSSLADKFL